MIAVYIAGPIRGVRDNNKEMFERVARQLPEQEHFVFNPLEQDEMWDNCPWKENFSIRKAFHIDMDFLTKEADMIVMLPQWQKSFGAQAEHAVAAAIGLPIAYLDSSLKLPAELKTSEEETA